VARIISIGEAMLELSRRGEGWTLGYGGDTLNTAIHLARAGHDVAYLTALGADPFSDDLKRQWAAEGLDTTQILTDPDRQPGLYAISTDPTGERSFTYWRSDSAARGMFLLPRIDTVLAQAEGADCITFSLITLAILPPIARHRLFDLCRRVRARGGMVAFDGNYRAKLWRDQAEAGAARDAAIAVADVGLPTLDDEAAMQSAQAWRAEDVAAHWQSLGCAETIVKLGARGCRLPDGTITPPPAILSPKDTSGAGDAFNGGYLAARLNGASVDAAALAGHQLAGWTVMRAGAIPALDEQAPY
jgi:2-dehydro-3-deoxygluconokinase